MLSHLPSSRSGTAGPEAVDLAAIAGLFLDPWQQWCLEMALSEQPDGRWSAFEVAVLVARQNGKGSILEARQLAGLFLLRERLQVHTAHEFKTCFEHFLRIVNLIEACPELDRRVARIRRGAGEQAIELKSGERLRFLARSGGSGRGMSGDAVYLDEAFALTPQMMGALLPTLSARENPQIWYMSSAPMSTSTVLHDVMRRGIEGASPRLFMANWGHDPGSVENDDVDAWYAANPALGIRITEEFVRSELDAMSGIPGEFARERLGVPDPLATNRGSPKLPASAWQATALLKPAAATKLRDRPNPVLTFDVDLDSRTSSTAVGTGSIADPYVQMLDHRDGVDWLPARLVELVQSRNPLVVGYNAAGPALEQLGRIMVAFREAGLSADLLQGLNGSDFRAACGGFYADVVEGRLQRPVGQQSLDLAGEDATERPLGEGWVWDRRQATIPISPLVAVTVARFLLPTEAEASKPVFAY